MNKRNTIRLYDETVYETLPPKYNVIVTVHGKRYQGIVNGGEIQNIIQQFNIRSNKRFQEIISEYDATRAKLARRPLLL